ncbi:MAG: hypothetical protein KDA61_23075, partial [Planctomycetales bacterium]|nr:hypothetical protein [Planctomycetales bacterium]
LLISALTLDGYLTLRLFAATRYDDAGRLQDAKAVWGFPAAFYVERGASTQFHGLWLLYDAMFLALAIAGWSRLYCQVDASPRRGLVVCQTCIWLALGWAFWRYGESLAAMTAMLYTKIALGVGAFIMLISVCSSRFGIRRNDGVR